MSNIAIASLVFALAAGLTSAGVYVQKRHRLYTRLFGQRAWAAHVILLAIVWPTLVVLLAVLSFPVWVLPDWLSSLGAGVLATGIVLFIVSAQQLGWADTLNGRFFGKGKRQAVRSGLYAFLKDPMYDSFILILVGVACLTANGVYLLFAAESFVFLNLIETRVERQLVTI